MRRTIWRWYEFLVEIGLTAISIVLDFDYLKGSRLWIVFIFLLLFYVASLTRFFYDINDIKKIKIVK